MKTVFLHIGPHKTGTTSIQIYLRDHMDVFAENGFEVIRDVRDPDDAKQSRPLDTNCLVLAHNAIRADLMTPVRIRGVCSPKGSVERDRFSRTVNARLRAVPHEKMIVSAEAFSFLRTPDEKATFDAMFEGLDLRPIAFFRNKHDWLKSWAAQVRDLAAECPHDASSGEGIFDFSENSWLVDHDRIRAFFGPKGNYLSYEDELGRAGSVIPGFLRVLGLKPEACPAWDGVWHNMTARSDV